MSETAKFKINLRAGEIEIEGSEDFVEKQIKTLESLLVLVKQGGSSFADDNTEKSTSVEGISGLPEIGHADKNNIPDTFGEWMHTFKSEIMDLDKALITARFVQSKSKSNDFKTSEVNKALKEHGIKLSNPSASLASLVDKKLMFQTRKEGTLKYLRVSEDGQKSLSKLKR